MTGTVALRTDGGRLLTEIADARGKVREYAVEPLPPSFPRRAGWRLVRTDTGEAHAVGRSGLAPWSCSCRGFAFRGGSCKHVSHVERLSAVLAAVAEHREPVNP
jgi:hypothetical protein